jgi:hypothetical protein
MPNHALAESHNKIVGDGIYEDLFDRFSLLVDQSQSAHSTALVNQKAFCSSIVLEFGSTTFDQLRHYE